MFMTVTLLSLIYRIPYGVSVFRTCIPNTQFQMNGHICYCDDLGRWSEANCEITRRINCQPGQIIWEDCNQCICQENGQLQCISAACRDDKAVVKPQVPQDLDIANLCLPFVSYYVNCSLCVCPASGKINEARCAKDAACPFKGSSDFLEAVKQNVCIPKVMYLFSCLQCLCSDDGFFLINKCLETCRKPQISDTARRCIPETLFRNECNICRCPENSIANEELCSRTKCNSRFQLFPLKILKYRTSGCHRNTFTNPKCYFCECNQNATVNENSCLESECTNIVSVKYGFAKDRCSPGEMVPFCTECLCLRNGQTDPKYCTNVCSHQQKLIVLEMVIKEGISNHRVIDKGAIRKAATNEVCEPNSIYLDEGKYCLCPDNGNTKFKLCTSIIEKNESANEKLYQGQTNGIDFTVPCDPSTFVEFRCNTCYCLKSGKLDPNWCTNDDCEAKKIIQERHKSPDDVVQTNGSCVAGSITKDECNFCICPANGQPKDQACTKNSCAEQRHSTTNEKLSCEPLAYYNVDCNICFCPKNGLKNVAKCTKNVCEKSFLRTEVCVPGDLFSQGCNICLCPPNGNKSDRVCTNHTCSDTDTPWKKIFKLSQSLLSNHVTEDTARSLELCFPGEEFEVGCKVCVCPDMGLRVYATCTHILCDEDRTAKDMMSDEESSKVTHSRKKRDEENNCMSYKLTHSSERKECTPGSMYIIRCRQCICPYKGNINHFCRPLPKGTYCEQPYPGYNYIPMGRRTEEKNKSTTLESLNNKTRTIIVPHNHTLYSCNKTGQVTDECFVCDCEQAVIIEEHCFKSDAEECSDRKPSFLRDKKDEASIGL